MGVHLQYSIFIEKDVHIMQAHNLKQAGRKTVESAFTDRAMFKLIDETVFGAVCLSFVVSTQVNSPNPEMKNLDKVNIAIPGTFR